MSILWRWRAAPDRRTDRLCLQNTHHHLVLGQPSSRGGNPAASAPGTAGIRPSDRQQQHHPNQVDDSHHCAGQVIGHVENLNRDRSRDRTCWTQAVTHWSMNVTDIWNSAEYHPTTLQCETWKCCLKY